MATGNPTLNESVFEREAYGPDRGARMTVQGAALKTGILLTILVAAAAFSWGMVFPHGIGNPSQATGVGTVAFHKTQINREAMIGFLAGGAIGGLVLSLIISFWAKSAPFLAPIYAVCEGLFIGAISGIYAAKDYPGIVTQALMLTVGLMGTMLTLYATRIIVMSDKLRIGIIAAVGAVSLVYLVNFILHLFGISIPYIHDSGPIGIIFSAVVVCVAAFTLLLDFETIEVGARYGSPKYMEWYSAFGLLVTLVWLYLEVLRLLSKLNRSNN
jgi:uncharacterized YccA/Bax inhibitor family protein